MVANDVTDYSEQSQALTDFLAYWNEKVERGTLSELTNDEIRLLKIYDEWMLQHGYITLISLLRL